MRLSRKALLYSALVFPGAGQWVLGQRNKAIIFIFSVTLSVIALAVRIFSLVYRTLVPSGDLMQMHLRPELIEQIHREAYADNWWLLLIIIGLWIASMTAAWREAKKIERAASPALSPDPSRQEPGP